MKKFIVTTTIYEPSEATKLFSKMKDWTLIVVGDNKTPHSSYAKIDCIYLTPEYQETTYPELSNAIGWNKIQRRSLGFVEAYKLGADILATVDDDNIPYPDWGENLLVGNTCLVDVFTTNTPVFDPLAVIYQQAGNNDVWHRGLPIEYVNQTKKPMYLGKRLIDVKVQADLWDGDPDIDAFCRLKNNPEYMKFIVSWPFTSDKITPFNSQNTFIHRDVIPYYMMLPFVGRMDDIWASYIVEKTLDIYPVFGRSSVYQKRNAHTIKKDLANEFIGYTNTSDFISGNYKLPDETMNAYNAYRRCFNG